MIYMFFYMISSHIIARIKYVPFLYSIYEQKNEQKFIFELNYSKDELIREPSHKC